MVDAWEQFEAEVSDVHLKAVESSRGLELDLSGSLIFPGSRQPPAHFAELLHELFGRVAKFKQRDFLVVLRDKMPLRGVRSDRAIDGVWFRMRRMVEKPPKLDTLPSRLPPNIERLLMAPSLNAGGIILVAGMPGSGKSTTAGAILVSRLSRYGGFASTVEDPVEIISLNGRHGDGYCVQSNAYEGEHGWEESIRELLRSQPVSTNLILLVGEIRTAAAAKMMLRAASDGFLVITTLHAGDPIMAVDNFFQMLGEEAAESLAASLRVVLHQRLSKTEPRQLSASILYSESSTSRVASRIRQGRKEVPKLREELEHHNQLARA